MTQRRRQNSKHHAERGLTLLEMMIAVTLVAGLSTGMLMAMRTSLLTYQKTAKKLESNRRFVKAQQILSNQIAAVIPAQGMCPAGDGGASPTSSFLSGLPDALRLISSYSIGEGARGYPQIVEYRVVPGEGNSVRLVAAEHPYTGPVSTTLFCGGVPDAATPPPSAYEFGAQTAAAPGAAAGVYVLADHLAYCHFSYHEPYDQNTFRETPWLPLWAKPLLPAGVRIEMRPLAPDSGGLSVLSVTIPIRVDRDPRLVYDDRF